MITYVKWNVNGKVFKAIKSNWAGRDEVPGAVAQWAWVRSPNKLVGGSNYLGPRSAGQASIRGDQSRYIFKILNCWLGNRSIGIVRCKYCIEWGKIAWPMHKIFNRFQNGKYLKEIVEACPSLQVEFTHYTRQSRSIIRSQVKNVSIITTHNTPKNIWESTNIKYLEEK